MDQRREEIGLTDNAIAVLKKRYLKKDANGEPTEEPLDLFKRVAKNIAEGELKFGEHTADQQWNFEHWYQRFLELMVQRKFMPNSPTLMNAGRPLQQLSACFVLPIEDSIDSIYDTLKHQAVIHKTGGGTGFSFSRLRPKNDVVKSTMGVSSGPVSFLTVYDASTEHIKQGGTRRGANMGILRVDHPDIEEFITCKKDNDRINNFNISVGITDEFMRAVKDEEYFALYNPRSPEFPEEDVYAPDLWRKICEGAWLNGEPGIVFLDKINARNPTPQFPIEATNPCSEAHLPPYDVCNLGSINVAEFLEESKGGGFYNWHKLADAIKTAVRFLDNVIEQNNYPLPEIEAMSKGNRRIGLGVMGFADLLIKLGIRYDSEEGFRFGEQLMEFFETTARGYSENLAKDRGNFPNWEGSIFGPDGENRPMRNATVTTIAPTGTISMIAGCSGGIEPIFAIAFKRRQADMEMVDVNPLFQEGLDRIFGEGTVANEYKEQIMNQIAEGTYEPSGGRNPELDKLIDLFRTAGDISSVDHIRMQAAFQKNTSMGISKTINLPNSATVEDVQRAYELAYELDCTGTAVYRDGSRDMQVLSTSKTESNPSYATREPRIDSESLVGSSGTQTPLSLAQARNGRPRTLSGVTKKVTTGHGPLYVTMNHDEFGPREVFISVGKAGGPVSAFTEALGRMTSMALTHGAPVEDVITQLGGIQDGHPVGFGPNTIHSIPDAISKVLAEHYAVEIQSEERPVALACPECSGSMTKQEGCILCHSCGYSKCS